MTLSMYNRLYVQAQDSLTVDEFISDGGSAHDVLDLYGEDTDRLVQDLTAIWCVAHDGTRYIRSILDMTQEELSSAYQIPRRTLEDWEGGARRPPKYVISLLAIASGVYSFDIKN